MLFISFRISGLPPRLCAKVVTLSAGQSVSATGTDAWAYTAGDMGRRIPRGTAMAGQLVLTGRAKDTIVMAGGENVSPQPIEDALCCSPLIKHAMVVGQDKRTLGAIVSLDEDGMRAHMKVRQRKLMSTASTCFKPSITMIRFHVTLRAGLYALDATQRLGMRGACHQRFTRPCMCCHGELAAMPCARLRS